MAELVKRVEIVKERDCVVVSIRKKTVRENKTADEEFPRE